jgi:hypothetical protein
MKLNSEPSKKKNLVSETGNAKNVANFNLIIEATKGYGPKYNPTKEKLKLPQLIEKHASAEADINAVIISNTAFNDRVNERIITFSDVNTYTTRLVNALETSEATPEKIKNARTFNRKIQGKRASAIQASVDQNTPAPVTISASQQSYDQKIEHFKGVLSVLESETTYAPNEADLTIKAATLKKDDLIQRNKAVDTAHINVSNSRITRDKNLYLEHTGMVDIALDVKKYVRSVFGSKSPEYALISGIRFKNARKK